MTKKPKLPGAGTTIKYSKRRKPAGLTTMQRAQAMELEEITDEPPGLINGKQAGSSYEWNIARALWAYGWDEFSYQISLRGGYNIKGGQVLDFLIPTRPAQTPLSVDGGYWHRNANKEKLYDTDILKRLRQKGYQVTNEVLHAKDKNAADLNSAKAFILKHFGRVG